MPNKTGLLYGGGGMKSVATLPNWLVNLNNTVGDPLRAYDASATLFRALEIRMNTIAGGELCLFDGDDAEIEEHPLLDALHNVNAEWNYSDLWRYTEAGGLIYGAGYWQKVRAGRQVQELFYLNPSTMRANTGPRGIANFIQSGAFGQQNQTFARQDVVYFRGAYDPRSDLIGKPGLRWVINAALGEGATEKYLESFFRNGAVPAVVFASDQGMGDTDVEFAVKWWNKLFQGVGNAFKTGFLGKGLKPYPVGSSIRDMELASVRTELRRTISIVTGVPELLFSSTDSADLTPIDLAMKLFYYTTVIDRWNWYSETLNAELVTEFPDLVAARAYLKFKTDNIKVLQEDATAKTARIVSLVNAHIITPEKAAEELGYKAAEATRAGQAAQAAAQQMAEQTADSGPAVTAQRSLAALDLERWQIKALKALERGKPAAVPFASDAIAASEHARIRQALAECKTAGDVHRIFSGDSQDIDELAALVEATRELKRLNDYTRA